MNIVEGLTYDDVLLIPQNSDISSRDEVDISSYLVNPSIPIHIPIISANMDTVTGPRMAHEMRRHFANGILHRFMSVQDTCDAVTVENLKSDTNAPVIVSIGVGANEVMRARSVLERHQDTGICIDVAHGDHLLVFQTLNQLNDQQIEILIAGNVATYSGARRLINHGVTTVKVGIGPGSLCTTRLKTGCGFPQLTAIQEVRRAVEDSGEDVTIIADGGIKHSGDIVKALAAGADTVMIGNIFAGTDESPGEVFVEEGIRYKQYRGMASRAAQEDWRGKATYVEGESQRIPYKGPVRDILLDLVAGVKSGFSYVGARNITELREKARFVRVTPAGLVENNPHGLSSY